MPWSRNSEREARKAECEGREDKTPAFFEAGSGRIFQSECVRLLEGGCRDRAAQTLQLGPQKSILSLLSLEVQDGRLSWFLLPES